MRRWRDQMRRKVKGTENLEMISSREKNREHSSMEEKGTDT